MLVRRVMLLVIAIGVLWKCITVVFAPLAPKQDAPSDDLVQPTPVERPARQARPTSHRRILRGQILLALQEQQVALDLCVPVGDIDRTLVSLELELLDGRARVADANVITEDTPDPAFLACVQAALRGRTLTAPSATPSASHTRVVFRLGDYL